MIYSVVISLEDESSPILYYAALWNIARHFPAEEACYTSCDALSSYRRRLCFRILQKLKLHPNFNPHEQ